MSIHPSLKLSEKDKKTKTVLKRSERIRMMIEKGQWKEGDNVYSLPKIKTVRIKIKKEKAAEKVEATATAEGAATVTAPGPKEQTPGKGPATKAQEKK